MQMPNENCASETNLSKEQIPKRADGEGETTNDIETTTKRKKNGGDSLAQLKLN